MRHLLLCLAALSPLLLAQRVVDPRAPWRVERATRVPAATLPAAFPAIVEGQFVRREGSVLMLGSLPFRFAGDNTYYLQADLVYGRLAGVEETLDKMVIQGLNVARANAHNDNTPASDPAVIQSLPGVYVESSLVALDRSIALAKQRNIRLILKLTNNWTAYGGIQRYVQWFLNRTPSSAETGLFYTEPQIRSWFKNYVKMIVDRRNTVTGTLYRDEPAILAWELGNELRNPVGGKGNDLMAWTAEMAAYIKQIAPNQLLADGGEGFDDDPSYYPGLSNRYPVGGYDGCSYHRLVKIPEVDMVSYHLYAAGWSLNDGTDSAIWIRRHEEMAREAGKVAYFGEYGKRADDKSPAACSRDPGRAFDPQRALVFQSWLQTNTLAEASAGHMVWQMINDGKDDCEGFQVYCPQDGKSCDVLKQFSDQVLTKTLTTVSGASYKAPTVAPASFASTFGADLAGVKTMVVDKAGQEREAQVFFAGATQVNFLVPPATPAGGAVVRVYREGALLTSGAVNVAAVEPGFFSAAADGKGPAAAVVTTVRPDGAQTYQFAARYDASSQTWLTQPIDLPKDGTVVVLSLYGTGIRNVSGVQEVSARVRGLAAEVLYAGAQPEYPGLDQVNIKLPLALANAGEVDVLVTVSGKPANVVRIALR